MNKRKMNLSLSSTHDENENNTVLNQGCEVRLSIEKIQAEFEEKVKISDKNGGELQKIKNYFEGKNAKNDLSFEW
jgi:regulator of RNase E activity RraB